MDVTQLTQLLGSVAAVLAAGGAWRTGKANGKKVDDVHELVNNRSQAQDNRIDQLGSSLTAAGVAVPDRPKE